MTVLIEQLSREVINGLFESFYGHAGRPGIVGGSAPSGQGSHTQVSKVPESRFKYDAIIEHRTLVATQKITQEFPQKIVDRVGTFNLHSKAGKEFAAGGESFQTGATWNAQTKTVDIYNANEMAREMNSEAYKEMIGHEIGHGIFNEWEDRSRQELDTALKNHFDWFDRGISLKTEYQSVFDKESPFHAARDAFVRAWNNGEDGITGYSKAWARWGNRSETVAEMTGLYYRYGEDVSNTLFIGQKAGNLGKAFLKMIKLMEKS